MIPDYSHITEALYGAGESIKAELMQAETLLDEFLSTPITDIDCQAMEFYSQALQMKPVTLFEKHLQHSVKAPGVEVRVLSIQSLF